MIERTQQHVFIDIIKPNNVLVHAGANILTFPSDPVSFLNVNPVPTTTNLSIYLVSGTLSEDMTSDNRTKYDLSAAGDLFYIKIVNGIPTVVANGTSIFMKIGGTGTLWIYFLHVAIRKAVVFVMVATLRAVISAIPYPAFNNSSNIFINELSSYSSTGIYQQAVLKTILILSNEDVYDISADNQTFYSVHFSGYLDFSVHIIHVSLTGIVSKVNGGTLDNSAVDIWACFRNCSNIFSKIKFSLSFEPMTLIHLNLSFVENFHGLVDFQAWPMLGATFVKNNSFFVIDQVALTLQEPGVYLPGLVIFASSAPDVAYVETTTGVVTLLKNHYEAVYLTVQAVSNHTLFFNTSFTANLEPDVGDIDMGNLPLFTPVRLSVDGCVIFIVYFLPYSFHLLLLIPFRCCLCF